jgi:hypothetical protein
VLAAATRAARRHGLAEPIPATIRFPGAARTHESQWQEAVVRHLGLSGWQRHELSTELDWLGPVARQVLREHGVLLPANAHFHAPLAADARGGTLLTGWGGDDLFASWRWGRAAAVLSGHAAPHPRDVARIAHLATPWAARRLLFRGRVKGLLPAWLRPKARSAALARWLDDERGRPRRWDRWALRVLRLRYVELVRSSYEALGRSVGAKLGHPLFEPEFVAAVARRGGRVGWPSRTAAMTALFSDLLPASLLERPTKAVFDEAFWGPYTRDFAETWDGSGADHELINAELLRREWLDPHPDARSALALQSAWLAAQSGS